MKNDVPAIVMNKLFEQGYEEQIVDIILEFEEDTTKEVSDIPLSPIFIENNEEKVIISEKVFQIYKQLVDRISNSETAQEIPFILLGNTKDIQNESYILIEDIVLAVDDLNNLDDLKVSLDEELFKKYLVDEAYNTISIGHTHGNVIEEKKNKSLARKLPDEIKEKYIIRDTGLNISVADIWQHEAFKQIARSVSNKRVLQTIIMYNGDFVVIDDRDITKSNQVLARDNNELVNVSLFTSNVSCKKMG